RTVATRAPTFFPYTTLFRSATAHPSEVRRTAAATTSTENREEKPALPPHLHQTIVPIMRGTFNVRFSSAVFGFGEHAAEVGARVDRKSTRLNSSHDQISYAV